MKLLATTLLSWLFALVAVAQEDHSSTARSNTVVLGYSLPMDRYEFKDKFKFVKKEKYAHEKKERIIYFFKDEPLTMDQILKLVKQFNHTHERQWVLKLMYPSCVEQEKYYQFAHLFKHKHERDKVFAYVE